MQFDFRSGRVTAQAVGRPVRSQGSHVGSVVDKMALGEIRFFFRGFTFLPVTSLDQQAVRTLAFIGHAATWQLGAMLNNIRTNKKRTYETDSLMSLPSTDTHDTTSTLSRMQDHGLWKESKWKEINTRSKEKSLKCLDCWNGREKNNRREILMERKACDGDKAIMKCPSQFIESSERNHARVA